MMPNDPGIVTPLEIISREQLEALEAAGWEISRPIECDIPGCDHRRSNRGYDLQQFDGEACGNGS